MRFDQTGMKCKEERQKESVSRPVSTVVWMSNSETIWGNMEQLIRRAWLPSVGERNHKYGKSEDENEYCEARLQLEN